MGVLLIDTRLHERRDGLIMETIHLTIIHGVDDFIFLLVLSKEEGNGLGFRVSGIYHVGIL